MCDAGAMAKEAEPALSRLDLGEKVQIHVTVCTSNAKAYRGEAGKPVVISML